MTKKYWTHSYPVVFTLSSLTLKERVFISRQSSLLFHTNGRMTIVWYSWYNFLFKLRLRTKFSDCQLIWAMFFEDPHLNVKYLKQTILLNSTLRSIEPFIFKNSRKDFLVFLTIQPSWSIETKLKQIWYGEQQNSQEKKRGFFIHLPEHFKYLSIRHLKIDLKPLYFPYLLFLKHMICKRVLRFYLAYCSSTNNQLLIGLHTHQPRLSCRQSLSHVYTRRCTPSRCSSQCMCSLFHRLAETYNWNHLLKLMG